MSTSNTLAQRPNVQQLMGRVNDRTLTFAARLTSVGDLMRCLAPQMMAALPKHVTPDRMIRVALNAIRKNPALLNCTAASLFAAITEAATYGWEIGGVLGHAYLVPYKDECQLIPGYKGLVDLCRRSGQVSTITCEAVHAGDRFAFWLGDDSRIEHAPGDEPDRELREITHVYAVVKLRDGGEQRSVWSRARIEKHKEQYSQSWRRAESNGKKDSMWHTAWMIAAKKTVLRDMINRGLLPVSVEHRELIERAKAQDESDEMADYRERIVSVAPLSVPEESDQQEASVEEAPQAKAIAAEPAPAPAAAVAPRPEVLEAVAAELDQASLVLNCEAIKTHWLAAAHSDAEQAAIVRLCEAKAAEIRSSRGESSNKT